MLRSAVVCSMSPTELSNYPSSTLLAEVTVDIDRMGLRRWVSSSSCREAPIRCDKTDYEWLCS